jgi:clan AA aspartic protease
MSKKTTSRDEQLSLTNDVRTIPTRHLRITEVVKHASEVKGLMGEVRVKVRLTNGVDQALVRRGLLPPDQVRYYETNALVDTGAIGSVLPAQVLQYLGLGVVRQTRAVNANDSREDVDVSEMVGIDIVDIIGRRTTEEMLVLGSEVLIGQTVLETLDLLVDCTNLRVVPNPDRPDQPLIKIKGIFNKSERGVQLHG